MEEPVYIIGSFAAVGVVCTMYLLTFVRRRSSPHTIAAGEQKRLTERIERLEAELWVLRDEQVAALEDVHEADGFRRAPAHTNCAGPPAPREGSDAGVGSRGGVKAGDWQLQIAICNRRFA